MIAAVASDRRCPAQRGNAERASRRLSFRTRVTGAEAGRGPAARGTGLLGTLDPPIAASTATRAATSSGVGFPADHPHDRRILVVTHEVKPLLMGGAALRSGEAAAHRGMFRASWWQRLALGLQRPQRPVTFILVLDREMTVSM